MGKFKRYGLDGGSAPLGVGFGVSKPQSFLVCPFCILLAVQDVSPQLSLTPCLLPHFPAMMDSYFSGPRSRQILPSLTSLVMMSYHRNRDGTGTPSLWSLYPSPTVAPPPVIGDVSQTVPLLENLLCTQNYAGCVTSLCSLTLTQQPPWEGLI